MTTTYTITHSRFTGTVTVDDTGEVQAKMPHCAGPVAKSQILAVLQFLEKAEYVSRMNVEIQHLGPVVISR